ncbi:hypothetical protein NO2_0025 [Candidatus Termititenax persephonae]|uniref:Uncharacterized protein n=1 Tax=Candidatus Termititenax persephonae TaxID=2218525 RepID=A0A388TF42_9BACT|nr:hypothetical protein NO2_0025 [Candidatus Termititenax persephonae]
MSNKLFWIILTLSQLLVAGVWQDFNGSYKTLIPPSYPTLSITVVDDFTPLEGQAVKFSGSTAAGAALVVIEGMSSPEDVDILTFFCKTDEDCEMQIALADSRKITAFENIKEYLPHKQITQQWQKAEYPLANRDINIHDLRKIYIQFQTLAEDTEELTLYLDDITLEKKENQRANYQVVYNFDNGLKSLYEDLPSVATRGAELQLTVESEGRYGSSGQSLQCVFETKTSPAEIFFPMTPYHQKNNRLKLTKTSLALRSDSPLTLELVPEATAEHKKAKFGEPYRVKRYQITLYEPTWQRITLPITSSEDYYGLRVYLPAQTRGVFYLDDLSLN